MVEERPVWIALNGVRSIVLSCSPHDPVPLAVGHLLSEGWIAGVSDVTGIQEADAPPGTTGVLLDMEGGLIDRMGIVERHRTIHGCGLRHALDCDPFAVLPVTAPAYPIDAHALLRELFALDGDNAGGTHAVALSDGVGLRYHTRDCARHCALDRALGSAALDGADLASLGIVTTARITAAMAWKAARCRIGWMASRSIATTLAHEVAAHVGLTIMERAGRRQ